jgi:hypothetical protein
MSCTLTLQPPPATLRTFLQLGGHFRDGVEVGVALAQRAAFGRDVAVVEAPELQAQLAHHLEQRLHAPCGPRHGISLR